MFRFINFFLSIFFLGFFLSTNATMVNEEIKFDIVHKVELMNQKDVALRMKANEELSKIFYTGAKEKGKY